LALPACDGKELDEIVGSPEPPTMASVCESSGNLVDNCGFDLDLSGWRTPTHQTPWAYVPDDGASRAGCVEVDATDFGGGTFFATVEQCMVNPAPACAGCVPTSGVYDAGAHLRITAGKPDVCQLTLSGTLDSDCRYPNGATALATDFAGSWTWSESAPASSQMPSGRNIVIRVRCYGSSPFSIRVDDVSLRLQ
jgi:hypothetical protein